jgi:alpha-tubulin suppressor-like RCC1 family protein
MKKQGLRRLAVIWGLALLIWLSGGATLALATVSDYQRHIITCGWGYCLAIQQDGTLWAWGLNAEGELGLGHTDNVTVPKRVGSSTNWVAVAGGRYHSLGLKADGSLWAWGSGAQGQLGRGDNLDQLTPARVDGANDWVGIAAGSLHSLGLKADGSLWAWGWNSYGQLGLGNYDTVNIPTRVTGTGWIAVSAGELHTLALKSNRTLWAWGAKTDGPNDGQLGLNDTAGRISPTQVGAATDWLIIAAGKSHSLGLRLNTSSITIWAWGYNQDGELGLTDTANRLVPTQVDQGTLWLRLAAGTYHSLGLTGITILPTTSTTFLRTWGYNNHGELGLGDTDNRYIPSLVSSGTNANMWQDLAAGDEHSLGLKADGSLWAWGWNDQGQLAQGDYGDRYTPVQVPGTYKPILWVPPVVKHKQPCLDLLLFD